MARDDLALGYYDDQLSGMEDDAGEGAMGYDDEMGLSLPFFGRRRAAAPLPRRRPVVGSQVAAYNRLLAPPPGGAGARLPGIRETIAGSAVVSFAAAAVGNATVNIVPYKRMKPTRLIVGYVATGTPGVIVQLLSALIGDRNQLGGSGPIDINAAFNLAATFVSINWDVIDPAVPLVLTLQTNAALAAASSITQSIAVYGINHN